MRRVSRERAAHACQPTSAGSFDRFLFSCIGLEPQILPRLDSPSRRWSDGFWPPIDLKNRTVTSIDGAVEVQKLQAYCPAWRRPFSPDRETLGFDARELTPLLIQRMTFAAAETRSFHRAVLVMRDVGDQPVNDDSFRARRTSILACAPRSFVAWAACS